MRVNFLRISLATLLIGIGTGIFLYIFTKASVSSFTHDESYTYLHYPHASFMDIVSYKGWYSNNHLLNTLFMKYSEKTFGSSETALRLPNLLLFIVYMVYGYLLFGRTCQLLAVAVFVLLCTNNLLIDLFGLARGYVMSWGFMLMSFYHFIESFYNQKTKNLFFFHVGALFAIMSNFTLLTFYVTLLLVYNLVIFMDCKFISNKKYNFLNSNKIHGILLLPMIVILYEPVRRVVMYNNFDYGGKNGFYSDTVTHLIFHALHGIHLSPFALVSVQILFTSIVLISFVIILRMIFKGNETFFNKFKGLIISNLLVVFISIAIILQHTIFGTDYPVARFSIFLYPIFIIHFGFFLSYFLNNGYKKVVSTVALCLALISITSFGLKADLHSCAEWGFDMETKNMLQKLTASKSSNDSDSRKTKLGINFLFEPTINFYRQTMGIDWLLPVNRNGITKEDDYYYIFKDELSQLNPSGYEIIVEFKRTHTLLLKNNNSR